MVVESDRLRTAEIDEFATADFLCFAFGPDPRLVEACTDPRRHHFITQLLDTPEFQALHAVTRLDDTAAAIAATHIAEQFAQLRKEENHHAAGEPLRQHCPRPRNPPGYGPLLHPEPECDFLPGSPLQVAQDDDSPVDVRQAAQLLIQQGL